jgi:hypothetical protein
MGTVDVGATDVVGVVEVVVEVDVATDVDGVVSGADSSGTVVSVDSPPLQPINSAANVSVIRAGLTAPPIRVPRQMHAEASKGENDLHPGRSTHPARVLPGR